MTLQRRARLQTRKPLETRTQLQRKPMPKRAKRKSNKRGPWRSPAYIAFVKTLTCVVCGAPADDAHHITGVGQLGGMGTKPGDEYAMPACRGDHDLIERTPSMWPDQWEWVRRTQQEGVKYGYLSEVTV